MIDGEMIQNENIMIVTGLLCASWSVVSFFYFAWRRHFRSQALNDSLNRSLSLFYHNVAEAKRDIGFASEASVIGPKYTEGVENPGTKAVYLEENVLMREQPTGGFRISIPKSWENETSDAGEEADENRK